MNTDIFLHPDFQKGRVDPRIFGGFLEHMGRAVYEGVYDPSSPLADSEGCRKDVLAALKKLDMTVMRYPGGNFASGYHWLDGVGPADKRRAMIDLAWRSVETNKFGTDEYIKLCRKMNWSPMLTVNLGTGTPEEARNWLEYCNSPGGTHFSDMRTENGFSEPHNVKLWCLGNEMDGHWQIGHTPAEQYAVLAGQAAGMMKDLDPSIELTACGTSAFDLPTYLDWDCKVLEYLGDKIDYISIHRYVGNKENDTMEYLAAAGSIDRQIEETDATCRFVQARRRSKKRIYLSFDEWNVWYKNMISDGKGERAPHLLEEIYNLEDALAAAGFLNSFIRHADCVRIANLSQAVNVIAPVMTRGKEILLQSTYYVFEMFSKRREGLSLIPIIKSQSYQTKSNIEASYADASAVLSGGILHSFVINRSMAEKMTVKMEISGAGISSLKNAELLTGNDPKDSNTFENPGMIKPVIFSEARFANGKAFFEMPPLSFLAASWELKG